MILADALTTCCHTIADAASFQRRSVCDEERMDRGSLEIFGGTLHLPRSDAPRQRPSTPWDEKVETEMFQFVAGAKGVDEWTPAFEPFDRRCGHYLLRWIEYQNSFATEEYLDPDLYVDADPRFNAVVATLDTHRSGSSSKGSSPRGESLTGDISSGTPIGTARSTLLADAEAEVMEEVDLELLARTFDRFKPETSGLEGAWDLKSCRAISNLCAVLQSRRDPRVPHFEPKREPQENIVVVSLEELEEEDGTDSEDEDTHGDHDGSVPGRLELVPDEHTSEAKGGNGAVEAAVADDNQSEPASRPASPVPELNMGNSLLEHGGKGSSTLAQRKKERAEAARRVQTARRKEHAAAEKLFSRRRAERLLSRYQESGFLHEECIGFVTPEHLNLRRPKKSRARRLMERRLKRRLADESTTDIVVQLVSKYV